ncbi:hypothetical protein HNY73_008099 [Argiope bruennichi]|uniref:Uncharacterized protein n=1 Tax=Argiope bruennichi TaxID=94029 RepID=A0A8T0F7S0_ARGBR|nr:hypothetical protein HNY73_008099 [Argiope bruennichi]
MKSWNPIKSDALKKAVRKKTDKSLNSEMKLSNFPKKEFSMRIRGISFIPSNQVQLCSYQAISSYAHTIVEYPVVECVMLWYWNSGYRSSVRNVYDVGTTSAGMGNVCGVGIAKAMQELLMCVCVLLELWGPCRRVGNVCGVGMVGVGAGVGNVCGVGMVRVGAGVRNVLEWLGSVQEWVMCWNGWGRCRSGHSFQFPDNIESRPNFLDRNLE